MWQQAGTLGAANRAGLADERQAVQWEAVADGLGQHFDIHLLKQLQGELIRVAGDPVWDQSDKLIEHKEAEEKEEK